MNYLQFVLSIIALLLGAQVWISIAEKPMLSGEAIAEFAPPGIPDAGSQRKQIIESLKDLTKQVEKTNELLKDAKFKVEVTNVQDLHPNSDGGPRP